MPIPKVVAGFQGYFASGGIPAYTLSAVDVTDYGNDVKDYTRVVTFIDVSTQIVLDTINLSQDLFIASYRFPITQQIEAKLTINDGVSQSDSVLLNPPVDLNHFNIIYPITPEQGSNGFTYAKGGDASAYNYSITDGKTYPLTIESVEYPEYTKDSFDRYIVFGRINTETGLNGTKKIIGAAKFTTDTVTRTWFNEYGVDYNYVWIHTDTKQLLIGKGGAYVAPDTVIDLNDYEFGVWVGTGIDPLGDEDAAPDLENYTPGGNGNEDLTGEPVTLAEAKAYMRIDADYTDDDNLISLIIVSAREELEKYTGLSFMVKELNYYTEKLKFEIPYGPVSQILYVKDKQGNDIDYSLEGLEFPVMQANQSGVNVLYTAGYLQLPKALKLAMLKQIATDYEYRENFIDGSVSELSNDAMSLAFKYSRNLFL